MYLCSILSAPHCALFPILNVELNIPPLNIYAHWLGGKFLLKNYLTFILSTQFCLSTLLYLCPSIIFQSAFLLLLKCSSLFFSTTTHFKLQ